MQRLHPPYLYMKHKDREAGDSLSFLSKMFREKIDKYNKSISTFCEKC